MQASNYRRTAEWLRACGKEKTNVNLSVQIGCDVEEYVEFLSSIELDSSMDQENLDGVIAELEAIASQLKRGLLFARIPDDKRADALDALCDREVTGNGVAYLADFNKEEADFAVLNANDAKLVDGKPVILPGGKIGKPPGWKAADLSGLV